MSHGKANARFVIEIFDPQETIVPANYLPVVIK